MYFAVSAAPPRHAHGSGERAASARPPPPPSPTGLAQPPPFLQGERGLDAGGVTSELFALLAAQTLDARLLRCLEDGTLFLRGATDPPEADTAEAGTAEAGGGGGGGGDGGGGSGGVTARKATPLQLYEAAGRLLGCFVARAAAQAAQQDGDNDDGGGSLVLPLGLGGGLLALLVDAPLTAADVRAADPLLFRFRVDALLEPQGIENVAAMLCADALYFVADDDGCDGSEGGEAGAGTATPLCAGGAARCVTTDNLHEYIGLFSEHLLCGALRREAAALLRGVWSVVPLAAMRQARLSGTELGSLFEGVAELDLAAWRAHTVLEPSEGVSAAAASHLEAAFFGALASLDADARARLFQFVTGLPRLPPGGFDALRPRFTLQLLGSAYSGRLPVAHTCFNALQLAPLEGDEADLARALSISVEFGSGAFTDF